MLAQEPAYYCKPGLPCALGRKSVPLIHNHAWGAWGYTFLPRVRMREQGLCDRSWCPYIIYCLDFFWNQSFISKNTHFEMSILTQIGFSSNLMASGTVQQLDKSSWPSQISIVCPLGKGSPMPETHIAPNHTPTIADTVPKWLNTPTLLQGTWH